MPKIDYPHFDKYPEVKGVYVGGCISRGDTKGFYYALAHAHTYANSHQGWICVRSKRRALESNGKPSQIMLHELAHILTLKGHTDKWRIKAHELGYRLPRRYWKKKRVLVREKRYESGAVGRYYTYKYLKAPYKK